MHGAKVIISNKLNIFFKNFMSFLSGMIIYLKKYCQLTLFLQHKQL
jgi:hypothetical protein